MEDIKKMSSMEKEETVEVNEERARMRVVGYLKTKENATWSELKETIELYENHHNREVKDTVQNMPREDYDLVIQKAGEGEGAKEEK